MKKNQQNLPTWDLEAIYNTPEAWENEFATLDALAANFIAYRGRLAESAEVFKAAIEASDAYEMTAEKLYVYAHLKYDENTSVSKNRARLDRISAKFAELAAGCAWFEPEVMAISDQRMQELLSDETLAFYKRSIEELLREKPHTLTEPEERLLAALSDVLGGAEDTFSTLNDTDMKFGRLKDETGKSMVLSHGSYGNFLESSDRDVRRAAFKRMYNTYTKYRNTLASTLDNTVKKHVASAKIRHYDSALQASLAGDNIPESIYTGLIDAVHRNLPALFEYFDLRRELLGVDALNMYDLHTPLISDCSKTYSFEEASELVKAALAPLGSDYVRDAEKAWSERWIDAPERPGKRSGAYSSGCYATRPYMLLNYNGTLSDVFALAHELGHSMHSYYSRQTQHYHYADYEIFVAEVASTTNELLLADHMLKNCSDPAMRAYLYGKVADEIRATIYRQTMFAEFELYIHQSAWDGVPLTADYLCENYYKLNAEYHGKMDADPLIAMEWARIPHFYYNFYVYKYATGMAAAVQLSQAMLNKVPGSCEKYLGFLKAGGSKDVLDIMLDAGVDLRTPAPVDAALGFFSKTVGDLRREMQR